MIIKVYHNTLGTTRRADDFFRITHLPDNINLIHANTKGIIKPFTRHPKFLRINIMARLCLKPRLSTFLRPIPSRVHPLLPLVYPITTRFTS